MGAEVEVEEFPCTIQAISDEAIGGRDEPSGREDRMGAVRGCLTRPPPSKAEEAWVAGLPLLLCLLAEGLGLN